MAWCAEPGGKGRVFFAESNLIQKKVVPPPATQSEREAPLKSLRDEISLDEAGTPFPY